MKDFKVEYEEPILILCDNTSAINISKNLVMHSKKNNIAIKHHFLREKVAYQEVRLDYITKKDKVEDIFTKPLPTLNICDSVTEVGGLTPFFLMKCSYKERFYSGGAYGFLVCPCRKVFVHPFSFMTKGERLVWECWST